MLKVKFQKWVKWEDRKSLLNLEAPGVYCIAKTNEDISGKDFSFTKDIIYFGESRCLSNRLHQFNRVLSGADKGHSGARTFMGKFSSTKGKNLLSILYVTIMPIGKGKASGLISEDWCRRGDARKLELYCIAEYLSKYSHIPECNK